MRFTKNLQDAAAQRELLARYDKAIGILEALKAHAETSEVGLPELNVDFTFHDTTDEQAVALVAALPAVRWVPKTTYMGGMEWVDGAFDEDGEITLHLKDSPRPSSVSVRAAGILQKAGVDLSALDES